MNEGGPQIWQTVPDYTGYEINTTGEVRSKRSGKILKPKVDTGGYLRVILTNFTKEFGSKQKWLLVHRIVAITYIVNNGGGELVCHRDGNKLNNVVTNLYWGTHSDNNKDTVKHGNHWGAKRTHCKNGHPFSGENLAYRSNGARICVECRRISVKKADRKRRHPDWGPLP